MRSTGFVPSDWVPVSSGTAVPSSQTPTWLEVSAMLTWTWSVCQTLRVTAAWLPVLVPVTSLRRPSLPVLAT